MSNTLYIKFLMRELIKCLETGKQKEAKKFIKKIMEELDRWCCFTGITCGNFAIINNFVSQFRINLYRFLMCSPAAFIPTII